MAQPEGQRPNWAGQPPRFVPGQPVENRPNLLVLFVLDTSGSMNQRSRLGMTLLDVAKHCIEHFTNTVTAKLQQTVNVSYMLMNFDEDPVKALKVQAKDNIKVLKEEISKLRAGELSNVGLALKNSFELLNMHRLDKNQDSFGLGRRPWVMEPTVVVMLTDGGPLVYGSGVTETLTWPPWTLQYEPFRWDQRLFCLTLRMPAISASRLLPREDCDSALDPPIYNEDSRPPVEPFCAATGGQSYVAKSLKEANGMVEHLIATKLKQHGVVVSFERIQGEPREGGLAAKLDAFTPAQLSQSVMLFVRHQGLWPIPEPFWLEPDGKPPVPLRNRCTIQFSTVATKWKVEDGFFDKYQIDSCLLTRSILELKAPDDVYQVFINKSYKNGTRGYPFGFLKPSSQNDCVNLFVMPYNYPVLFDLLAKWKANPNPNVNAKLGKDFEAYINDIPYYYIPPLRTAVRQRVANLEWAFPSQETGKPPAALSALLAEHKQKEKETADKFYGQLKQRQLQLAKSKRNAPAGSTTARRNGTTVHDDIFGRGRPQGQAEPEARNPFDTPRMQLLDTLYRISSQFFAAADGQPVLDDEEVDHEVPCSEMGAFSPAYERALARQEASKFRDVKEDESSGPKGIPFGNPWVDDKAILANPSKRALQPSGTPEKKRPRISPGPGGGGTPPAPPQPPPGAPPAAFSAQPPAQPTPTPTPPPQQQQQPAATPSPTVSASPRPRPPAHAAAPGARPPAPSMQAGGTGGPVPARGAAPLSGTAASAGGPTPPRAQAPSPRPPGPRPQGTAPPPVPRTGPTPGSRPPGAHAQASGAARPRARPPLQAGPGLATGSMGAATSVAAGNAAPGQETNTMYSGWATLLNKRPDDNNDEGAKKSNNMRPEDNEGVKKFMLDRVGKPTPNQRQTEAAWKEYMSWLTGEPSAQIAILQAVLQAAKRARKAYIISPLEDRIRELNNPGSNR